MITISITGLDGCGKSTQAKLLAEKLPNSRIVSVWDIIKRPEFQDWTIYRQPPKVENYVAHLHPVSRSLFIFHAFNEAYQKAIKSEAAYLILDGNWYKYWAVEQAMGSPEVLGAFFQNQYPNPDVSIYLKLEIEQILQRKQAISIYESGGNEDKLKKFVQIQTITKDILEKLLPANTLFVDARKSIDDQHLEILKHIENQIDGY